MRVKQVAYLLILLLIWAQFDDLSPAAGPVLPAALVTDEDDEYISAEGELHLLHWSVQKNTPHLAFKPGIADATSCFVDASAPLGSRRAARVGASPLYVFMSLQL
jgi:hypothetical protein